MNRGRIRILGTVGQNFLAGFIEWDLTLSAALANQLYETSVMGDVGPGQLLKFAASQASMGQELDHVQFLRLADSKDLLIFLVIEYPHFWWVLMEHLDLQAGIRQIIMFGQPAAETFQGSKV